MGAHDLRIHPSVSARLVSIHGAQIREDSVFTNDRGEEKKGIRKNAEKALEKLRDILPLVLASDEVVLYVARCQSPVSAFEQITLGWYIYYVTGVVVVLTNRRLLHFDVTRSGDWKRMLRAVSWGDLEEAKITGWLSKNLALKYRSGRKAKYWKLSRQDGKKIKVLVEAIYAGGRESSSAQTMTSLCPQCRAELTPRVYDCAKCGFAFKDEKTMVRRSWLIPGGGYLYTRHWFLGIGDFLVEAYLLILVLTTVLIGAGVIVDTPREPGDEPLAGAAAWAAAAILAAVLGVEKVLTVHHCRRFIRDFMPKN